MRSWIFLVLMLCGIAASAQIVRPSEGGGGSGTVTSVAATVPTGLSISGSPITSSGTLAFGLASGYSIPTTANQTNWTAGYNDKVNSLAVTGTTTKTLTLTQQDAGTVSNTFTDFYDSTYFNLSAGVLSTKSGVNALLAEDTIKVDIIAPDDSTSIYFTKDVRTAENFYGDTIFVDYLGGTIGIVDADTFYIDTTVTSGLSNLANIVVDTTTGQLHIQALAAGGGTSYWELDGNALINDTANSDTVRVPDGLFEVGASASITGQIDIHSSSGAGSTVTLRNNVNVLATNGEGFRVGYSGNNYAGIQAQNGSASGTAHFRPAHSNNYGWGGNYQTLETIIGGDVEVSVTDTTYTLDGNLIKSTGTISDNDATPDFTGKDIWTYNGSANAVTITDIDNPVVGATYTIIGNSDTYTVTIADGGNFNLSAQWVGGIDDVLILYVQADNDYIELGRVDN